MFLSRNVISSVEQKTFDSVWQSRMQLLEECQVALGFVFQNTYLLMEALTHSSAAREVNRKPVYSLRWNERLEFLGDAVLNLAVATEMMASDDTYDEGLLSRIRAGLVREESLLQIAQKLDVGRFLLMGRGEVLSGGQRKHSVLADAVEALIGAVYLDAGFYAAQELIGRLLGDFKKNDWQAVLNFDHKTKLQEILQAEHRVTPRYETEAMTGPAHDPEFCVSVWREDEKLAEGRGRSKKQAAQNAAQLALKQIQKPSRDKDSRGRDGDLQ